MPAFIFKVCNIKNSVYFLNLFTEVTLVCITDRGSVIQLTDSAEASAILLVAAAERV
jgi:hypothetical protein